MSHLKNAFTIRRNTDVFLFICSLSIVWNVFAIIFIVYLWTWWFDWTIDDFVGKFYLIVVSTINRFWSTISRNGKKKKFLHKIQKTSSWWLVLTTTKNKRRDKCRLLKMYFCFLLLSFFLFEKKKVQKRGIFKSYKIKVDIESHKVFYIYG